MKNIKKTIVLFAAGFIGYLGIGMLLPFRKKKRIAIDTNMEQKTKSIYYGTNTSTDRAMIVESSTDALEKRIQMIEHAKQRIILTTFDMRKGESSSDIAAALMAAAGRGVSIKILVDGMSGMVHMKGRNLFLTLASCPGIELRIYNKINLFKPWGIHGRMHDKYVIVDNECYLLGGRNSFDYFLGDYTEKNRSYDREVFVYNTSHNKSGDRSSSLFEVESYFNSIWNSKFVKAFRSRKRKNFRHLKMERTLFERYLTLKKEKPEWFKEEDTLDTGTFKTKKITLVSGEQHIFGKRPVVWNELKKLMLTASESIELHTPYAVLDDEMYQDISEIKSKVSDFKIVLNSVANGDNFMASSDYIKNKLHIMKTGVQLYEFDGGDSAHGKSILIDDRISVVGSYNLDLRSTYVDTELMLVIDSEEVNESLDSHLQVFRNKSRKVLGESEYEENNDVTEKEVSWKKRTAWKILGVIMKPFRFLI